MYLSYFNLHAICCYKEYKYSLKKYITNNIEKECKAINIIYQ